MTTSQQRLHLFAYSSRRDSGAWQGVHVWHDPICTSFITEETLYNVQADVRWIHQTVSLQIIFTFFVHSNSHSFTCFHCNSARLQNVQHCFKCPTHVPTISKSTILERRFPSLRKWCCFPLSLLTETVQRGDPKKTRRVNSLFGSCEAVEARNVIPLTAERHWRSRRGNTTEQFESVWMKLNPHSSPPPICRLIYSQVHSAAAAEGAQATNLENTQAPAMIHSKSVTLC